jgi:hypothetical protein
VAWERLRSGQLVRRIDGAFGWIPENEVLRGGMLIGRDLRRPEAEELITEFEAARWPPDPGALS